ncbi:MAG: archaemetzincin family Zn-dependent metalloprotease [Candidatus Omnitrophica bacterium]|nr:archaemetzincin family Zn-dependent metalloprotease [Candidatus Omnitrophota bacterium]MCM8832271.1 archaemetzincin family Zn-dependent metalloprotease [Candidatus Omnitrophota bacterium]
MNNFYYFRDFDITNFKKYIFSCAICLFLFFILLNTCEISAFEKMHLEIITFGNIDDKVLTYLSKNLEEIFSIKVYIGSCYDIPQYAYNQKRNQYLALLILDKIQPPKENQKILAIIDKDLYTSGLNFVFGQAEPNKGVCIISLTRLRQSYYGLKEDERLFLERALKEAVHEIGHLFNLGHCSNPKCVMHFSNSLLDTDIKDYHFCNNCKKYLFLR